MTQFIKKLPAVFQTVTEKKFFDATFDQVFSKKDSDLLYGYIGRRDPGRYQPITDFYLPEPTKDRTWWQLEATAFARNEDTTKSNVFFYDDLLNRINFYGGNTLNQDRLFQSQYYSWAPPIDFDMFVNYQNYYWVEQGLATITITGVQAADIIGKPTYTTPSSATPPNFTLSSGMNIMLASDPAYNTPHIVENLGGCQGLRLVTPYSDITSGTVFEFLPWDGVLELGNGRVIRNTVWDTQTWDVQAQPGIGDYITIQRGSLDRNAWSRTNKWFHIDTINKVSAATNTPFPSNATRALRPIIQFVADLILFNSGTNFRSEIQYGFFNGNNGQPIALSSLQGQSRTTVNQALNINIAENDIVVFFGDETNSGFSSSPVKQYLYQVEFTVSDAVLFTPVTDGINPPRPLLTGDIVFALLDAPNNGAKRGQTWYLNDILLWSIVTNDKVSVNQAPLFQLFDHNNVPLINVSTYTGSTFQGSKIFSYKVDTTPGARVDPVLKFPVVYTSLGQASDIMFQNNLITDRYTYTFDRLPIEGYYYYSALKESITNAGIPITVQADTIENTWNLYAPCPCDDITPPPPCNCIDRSKQRVIDRYVVGYGTEYQFKLSVTPYGYPESPDLIVTVNGTEVLVDSEQTNGYSFEVINNSIYVNLSDYLTNLLIVTQSQPPVVEIQTYTWDLLDPAAPGYFQIPQQLEANPSQLEITEISGSNLNQQFSSIIANQIGFEGVAFGGDNNYRDSRKNRSVGLFILQNISPLLKAMLVSSDNDLDLVQGIRFSQDEYTKFKNKFLRTAKVMIDQEFSPTQYHNNTIVISQWTDQILKTINVSREYSNAFAYSYMIASGSPYTTETRTVPSAGAIQTFNYVDLNNPKNAMYIFDASGTERLLTIGVDYEIVSQDQEISIRFFPSASLPVGDSVQINLYTNSLPAYIPTTPAKIGLSSAYIPKKYLDTSFTIPTNVIIGHDGSKTIAYNDYRDDLLLDLETRIYNLIQSRFRFQWVVPNGLASIKSGYFRATRYSRKEFLEITESYLNKWSTKNKANYRTNDWATYSQSTPTNQLWKLYNYSSAVNPAGQHLNLPGNWKGIYQYYYDTIDPAGKPWEMLGFSEKPNWWVQEYGAAPYTSTSAGLHFMWNDLEAGIIRQGPSAVYDPVTLQLVPNPLWTRPGLSALIPVDNVGNNKTIQQIFNVSVTGNPYEPFDGFDSDWVYGDVGPVEAAWQSTSGYQYSVQEFMYLMRPGPYCESGFDTLGVSISPGMINPPNIVGPVRSSVGRQVVQNDTYTVEDPFYTWTRPKNKYQIVHGESVDGVVQVRSGYQNWISDRILFLGKDVGTTFGQKIRTLDVNLANKLAGFTNKDTTNMYFEGSSPTGTTGNLLIPTNNFDVLMHKGQPLKTYSYSGVVIRALGDGTFVVYGYDLLNAAFTVLNRSNDTQIEVTVGGTPAEFRYYTANDTYAPGDIVRYNGVYYESKVLQVATVKFDIAGWTKLKALPIIDGVTVSYRPYSTTEITYVPYGTILTSVQDVFDLLIGWGAFLESQGWQFTEVTSDTNQVSDWLYSAKQFLFWLNSNWAPDAAIQLSPLANKATVIVERGYPDDVEIISNGVYSILDKYGVAIPPNSTSVDREGQMISVSPTDLAAGGIYFLQVSASETEHVLIFDNVTNFNDVVYDPLLRARQQRLRYNGFRSNGWYGKMEAPGYLIIGNQLVPNYDSIVDAMRYYYDPDVTIDNPSLEDLGRHLIGYESKSYLDNLQVSNDVQYLFYQGAIRQKGTVQAFDKLFRSTKVQSNETIEVFEEWALKLADFGNTVEQVSTEFILKPEQNTGEVIVARLNFVPSSIGTIKQINIVNAQSTYLNVPKIVIPFPDADPANPELTRSLRQAKAYAVLDSRGVISRVDITDGGYGYTYAPPIQIDSGAESNQLDILYSVFQGAIVRDDKLDNVIEIDIDDTDKWISRPTNPALSLEFPTTARIDYPLPNSGYVNFNDVDYASFDVTQTVVRWGTQSFNPVDMDTVWVAKTFTEDWEVYKMVNISESPMAPNPWRIIEDESGNLLLLTNYSDVSAADNFVLLPQLAPGIGAQTDFGNLICLQTVNEFGKVDTDTNYTVGFADNGLYTDIDTLDLYNSYQLVTLDNVPITATDIPLYAEFTDLLLFKTMRFNFAPTETTLPSYVGIYDLIWVDNLNEKWQVLKVVPLTQAYDTDRWDAAVIKVWSPNYGWDARGPFTLSPFRVQENLINTSLFQSATVFEDKTESMLVQLPVYDPFKSILPAVAKQNISYISMQDPARYNVTGDSRLFTDNISFASAQVGKLWWDTSDTRYVYYEQPLAMDLSESELQNLVYRRDRWGQLFPGSDVKVFEWTKSPVPPDQYVDAEVGTGTPRSLTDYVQIATTNRITNITTTSYYFWVRNATNLPNVQNRTAPALDVQRLLQTPRSQGFVFFAPIQQTLTNNSYMFYNVQEILIYKGDNVQVQYRLAEREDQEHTQWKLFREGDPASIVTPQYWNKLVDSICAYTRLLPASDEITGILIAENLPWDIFAWDVTGWDTATNTTDAVYGEILPVPDPMLSEAEKYGIQYRPRQGMFVNLQMARKIFVQAANELLKHIPIRDDNPGWDDGLTSANYWVYTTWYEEGYENVVPTLSYGNLGIASAAVGTGTIPNGTIIEVANGTADGRFALYVVVQINPNIPTQSLERIGLQDSAIKLLDTIYTQQNVYLLSTEVRQLLNAFRTQVFIDENLVDQNSLYFSMLNYVLSEQRTPDWVFKSSYIYIKENNLPMTQDPFYNPDQIDNIIQYIMDSKPYHTQIRDYTSTYVTSDLAFGIASDSFNWSNTLTFGPNAYGPPGHWDTGTWDDYGWDISPMPEQIPNTLDGNTYLSSFDFGYNPLLTANVDQLISDEIVYTVSLTTSDPSKKGYSTLFPYTFTFDSINHNNPQNVATPANVVGVRIGDDTLIAGQDFYVETNVDGSFTAYFFEDPSTGPTPEALVWYYGGSLMNIEFNTYRNEVAYGEPSDDMVVNVDTKLPVNLVNGVIEPYVGWDNVGWEEMEGNDLVVEGIIIDNGGSLEIHWDAPLNPVILDQTISYKQNVNLKDGQEFYRNSQRYQGTLVYTVPAPTAASENLDVITVSVDPTTHPFGTNILPEPTPGNPGVVWINGERIEYLEKTFSAPNEWQLTKVRRGTHGTAPVEHTPTIPSIEDPLIQIPNPVWVEKDNILPDGSADVIWNLTNPPGAPIPSSVLDYLTDENGNILTDENGNYLGYGQMYTSVGSVPIGGLWYSNTDQAIFLKEGQQSLYYLVTETDDFLVDENDNNLTF